MKLQNLPGSIHENSFFRSIDTLSSPFFKTAIYSGYGFYKLIKFKTDSFKNKVDLLNENFKMIEEQIESYQINKMRDLLCHSYSNVNYYRKLFDKIGFNPEIENIDEINEIPLLTKEIITENYEDLISDNFEDFSPKVWHTGGSTGKPLRFLIDKEMALFRLAELRRHWSNHGYDYRDKVVIIRGRVLETRFNTEKSNPWVWDYSQNFLYLSSYHLNDFFMNKYADLIRNWKPKFISAYPHSIFTFCKFLLRNKIKLNVDVVFTSSETLFPHYREIISKALNCKVVDHYGLGEPGTFASGECCEGNIRFSSDISYVEIVDSTGNSLNNGQNGEIVETCLHNFSMPFIRYRTNDYGMIRENRCGCESDFPIINNLEGSVEDMIINSVGASVSPASLTLSYEYIMSIDKCQFLQDSEGNLTIKIVPKPSFTSKDWDNFKSILKKILGKKMPINLELVDKIPLTISGKYRFCVSNYVHAK